MARWLGVTRDVGRWARERDAIRDYLIDEAAAEGWFPQAVGVEVADASTLLMPAMGLLPTRHPLAQRTIERVRRDLERDGLVYRYRSADGLAGTEGAFFLCSFWLVDCLTHTGELEEAQALLERLLGLANDVGLYSEEIDPESGEALGNFPQAFTHMALVLSCAHLSAAKRGLVPYDGAHDYAELAVERLLAAGRRAEPAVR
jgi:GH15 family glucan-1,4-alpha-glucosidase